MSDHGAPPLEMQGRGHRVDREGARPAAGSDEDLNNRRKIAHAVRLRFEYGMTYHDIAAQPWPLDDQGNPAEGAERMWRTYSGARLAIKRFAKALHRDIAEEAVGAILHRAASRHAALWPAVERGDTYAAAECRANDEFLSKLLGLNKPIKVAPTTPDGNEPAPGVSGVLVVPAAIDPEAWSRQAAEYQRKLLERTTTDGAG